MKAGGAPFPVLSGSPGGRREGSKSPSCGEGSRMKGSAPSSTKAAMPSNTDRKSTRLNSSHSQISYAVFCLKKKKKRNELKRQQVISSHSVLHSLNTQSLIYE